MRGRITGGLVAGSMALLALIPGGASASNRSPAFRLIPTLAMPGVSAHSTTNSSAATASDAGPFCSAVQRSTTDRPDTHQGRLVHVVYMLASGATDDHLDIDGTLACSVAAQNEWLRAQTQLEWRWDTAIVDTSSPTDPNSRVETIDVTFVQSSQPASALDSGGEVMAELKIRGFDDANKRYLTYVAAGNTSGICGDAFYPLTRNFQEGDGQFAQVYLDSVEGCGARDFGVPATGGGLSEAIAQQELMHNDGITPIGAPHTCMNAGLPYAHVCTGPLFVLPDVDPEGVDVMFPYVYYPLREKVVDRDHDDYFRHDLPLAALEDSPYLQAAGAWGDPYVQPRGSAPPQSSPPSAGGARSIDLSAGSSRVEKGGAVALSGRIHGDDPCVADQPVTLRRRLTGKPRPAPSLRATTGAAGEFELQATMKRSTRFVAVVDATADCGAARSAPVTVAVR